MYSRGPKTVFWTIPQVVISSFQRCAFRARTHITQKNRKIPFPFIAHDYAAPAVVLKTLCLWIKATIFSSAPDFIFGRSVAGSRVTVPCAHSACRFTPVTAAASGSSLTKILRSSHQLASAVAETKPFSASRVTVPLVSGALQNEQPTKTLARVILKIVSSHE